MNSKRIAAVVGTLAVAGLGQAAQATLLYATSGSSVSRFDDASIGSVTTVPVTGLQVGETLVGFDVRPNGGTLVGVGSTSRLYFVDPITGLAVQTGSLLSPTLAGTKFGLDFNPTVDRLRIVSDAEQNLRVNAVTGATTTDTALTPAGNVVEVAYTNSFPGSTTTTLYGIDSAAGTLVTLGGLNSTPSPNLGGVNLVGSLGLGTNLNPSIGFDITPGGIAYAAITTGGGASRLYTVNLTTGAATLTTSNGGLIGIGQTPYVGLTAVPEPGAVGLLAVAAGGLLARRRRRQA